jgi:hypothetical protein
MARHRITFSSRIATLRDRVETGRIRPVARFVVDVAIESELCCLRAVDRVRSNAKPVDDDDLLTVVIKTFERPRETRRLVKSVRRSHPHVRIVIVDDSRHPQQIDGTDVIPLPFNSGVSKGRRIGFESVETPFCLTMDDDFVMSRRTRLGEALKLIDSCPDIDVLGGAVINLPDLRRPDYSAAHLYSGHAAPVLAPGTDVGGLPVRLKVPNFFLARTERLLSVGWDDELKFLDHADFFTRASGRLVTVQDERFFVYHGRNPFDRSSPERRANMAASRRMLSRRYARPG